MLEIFESSLLCKLFALHVSFSILRLVTYEKLHHLLSFLDACPLTAHAASSVCQDWVSFRQE